MRRGEEKPIPRERALGRAPVLEGAEDEPGQQTRVDSSGIVKEP